MRIDSSGRIIQRYSAAPYNDRALTLQSPSGQTTTALAIVNTETNGQSNIVFGDHVGQNAGNSTGFITYSHQTDHMAFATNGGSERMRIDSVGNLNLGTASNPLPTNSAALINMDVPQGKDGINIKQDSTHHCINIWRSASNGNVLVFYRLSLIHI